MWLAIVFKYRMVNQSAKSQHKPYSTVETEGPNWCHFSAGSVYTRTYIHTLFEIKGYKNGSLGCRNVALEVAFCASK